MEPPPEETATDKEVQYDLEGNKEPAPLRYFIRVMLLRGPGAAPSGHRGSLSLFIFSLLSSWVGESCSVLGFTPDPQAKR